MGNQAYTMDSPGLLSGALLNCRTVIEGSGCVATGMLSYMEGDLIDIELPQFEHFELGEQVKVTIYSGMGIVNFFTKIIARNEGSLLLIHPPQQQQRFTDKRESPRVIIRKHGFIHSEAASQENRSAVQSGTPITPGRYQPDRRGLHDERGRAAARRHEGRRGASIGLHLALPPQDCAPIPPSRRDAVRSQPGRPRRSLPPLPARLHPARTDHGLCG